MSTILSCIFIFIIFIYFSLSHARAPVYISLLALQFYLLSDLLDHVIAYSSIDGIPFRRYTNVTGSKVIVAEVSLLYLSFFLLSATSSFKAFFFMNSLTLPCASHRRACMCLILVRRLSYILSYSP